MDVLNAYLQEQGFDIKKFVEDLARGMASKQLTAFRPMGILPGGHGGSEPGKVLSPELSAIVEMDLEMDFADSYTE